MNETQMTDVMIEVLTEIERHVKNPISKGEVVIPMIVPATDGTAMLRRMKSVLRDSAHLFDSHQAMKVGNIVVYVDPKGHEDPVNIRGSTVLMCVWSTDLRPTKYGQQIVESTLNLAMTTARMNGYGGRIVRY